MDITIWIMGDQLLEQQPTISQAEEMAEGGQIRILLVESQSLLQSRRYHAKKLVLLLSAMRHYADELKAAGLEVDYRRASSFTAGLEDHLADHQVNKILTMAANNWQGRRFQEGLAQQLGLPVEIVDNTQFIANRLGYNPNVQADKRLTQETYYREMRSRLDLLMTDDGDPVGGQWNFDEQNREPLPTEITPPSPLSFEADPITQEVTSEVAEYSNIIGSAQGFDLAVSRQQARQAADNFFENRLEAFGTYEDAMKATEPLLFHSMLSPYLNIGLLDPLELALQAEKHYQEGTAPLNSVEGFIRQIIGWREYMNWQYWRTMPSIKDGNFLNAVRHLPEFFWSGQTEMNCLQTVIERAIDQGYNHHIERLMVLSNYCLLSGIQPEQVLDWFMAHYLDAYDWVMVPNVLGMGLYADGGLTSTKPYAASANYINKMSDFCDDCGYFRTKRVGENACPFNSLYWNFMLEHEQTLRKNPRMGTSLLGLRHFDQPERDDIQNQAQQHFASFS